jgi:hypothetical protein
LIPSLAALAAGIGWNVGKANLSAVPPAKSVAVLPFVNNLMAAFGQPHPDYYTATDLSRDRNSVPVVGNPPLIDAQSTPDLVWPGQTVTP